MSDTSAAKTETFASQENDWVRARILKNDPPSEGSLLQIAERALRMANDALGSQHQARGVALLNLGLYYDCIEHDDGKAAEFFEQARAILDKDDAGRAKFAEASLIKSRADRQRKHDEAKQQAAALPDNTERQQNLARSYMDMARMPDHSRKRSTTIQPRCRFFSASPRRRPTTGNCSASLRPCVKKSRSCNKAKGLGWIRWMRPAVTTMPTLKT